MQSQIEQEQFLQPDFTTLTDLTYVIFVKRMLQSY